MVLNSMAGDWTLTEEARDVLRALDEAVDGASGMADLTDSEISLPKSVSRGVRSPPVPPPPPPPPIGESSLLSIFSLQCKHMKARVRATSQSAAT